jgi:hypothetical protein
MNQRMLIFMSNYDIEWARESKMLFGDGTFKHTPDLSFQFYVNFTQKNGVPSSIYSFTIEINRGLY